MNPHRGDVPLQVGAKIYTLCYSHLALVKLENKLDKSVVQIMTEMQNAKENLRIGMVVALLWAGLQKHHPNLSYDDAAGLLDDVEGGAAVVMEVIGKSFEKAFATPELKDANPPLNGNAGIGMTSSLSSSVSVIPLTPSGT